MKNKSKIFFGIRETSERLGISRDTLMNEINDRKISYQMRGKRKKFSEENIREYEENQKVDNSGADFSKYKYVKKCLRGEEK